MQKIKKKKKFYIEIQISSYFYQPNKFVINQMIRMHKHIYSPNLDTNRQNIENQFKRKVNIYNTHNIYVTSSKVVSHSGN